MSTDSLIRQSADYLWKKMQRGESGVSRDMIARELSQIIRQHEAKNSPKCKCSGVLKGEHYLDCPVVNGESSEISDDTVDWKQVVHDLDLAASWLCPEDVGRDFSAMWEKLGKDISEKLLSLPKPVSSECIDEGCPHHGKAIRCEPKEGGCVATVPEQPDDLLQWVRVHYNADGPAAYKPYWNALQRMLERESEYLWQFKNDQEVINHFLLLWREYGNFPDNKLTAGGKALKEKMLAAVKQIEGERK